MNQKEPMTIYQLFDSESFRKRTPMYIGEKSISKLRLFMIGYEMCEQFNKIKSKDTRPPFWLFFPWICKYYNHNGSYYNWDGIILQNCENDEAKALDTFFARFDEFRTYKPIKILSASILDSELDFFHNHGGIRWKLDNENKIRIGPSKKLYLVEYGRGFGNTIHHMNEDKSIYSDYRQTVEETLKSVEREYGKSLNWTEATIEELEDIYEMINKSEEQTILRSW